MTNGHVDILRGSAPLVGRLVIGIGRHAGKSPLFSVEERLGMLEETRSFLAPNIDIEVVAFDGLAVEAARAAGATVLIRGVRDGTDLDYEMQMAAMNRALAPDIQTVFIPASPQTRPISATLVRQIAALGGDVSAFVPEFVAARLKARFGSPA